MISSFIKDIEIPLTSFNLDAIPKATPNRGSIVFIKYDELKPGERVEVKLLNHKHKEYIKEPKVSLIVAQGFYLEFDISPDRLKELDERDPIKLQIKIKKIL